MAVTFPSAFGCSGWLGFTPLAEGLDQLWLDLCTTPDCGLVPPAPATTGAIR